MSSKRPDKVGHLGSRRFHSGDGGIVPCKCPRCEKKHRKQMFYTGHLPARVYCRECWKTMRAHQDFHKEYDYGGRVVGLRAYGGS